MKFYMTPGSCSTGIHILLEELELVFEVHLVNLLAAEGYALGCFSIADAALFYVEFWADKSKLVLPEKCLAHYRLMCSRPAVRRVLQEERCRVD